jgi:hypothetical protein
MPIEAPLKLPRPRLKFVNNSAYIEDFNSFVIGSREQEARIRAEVDTPDAGVVASDDMARVIV